MILERGYVLTSRKSCFTFLAVSYLSEIEWFRFPSLSEPQFTPGEYEGTYVLEERICLLNLGNKNHRQMILDYTTLSMEDLNLQYTCDAANLKVHRAILSSDLTEIYVGTIASEERSEGSLKGFFSGINEVVIFPQLLSRVLTLVLVKKHE